MRAQTLLLVDDHDKFKGYDTYDHCHTGKGKRHRAFVTLLFDQGNKVLLQKRKHRLFDGYWDLTAISHPLHVDGHDESFQEASDRALKKEMGIDHVRIENVGAFNYFAKDGGNCENEHCAVLVGKYDGDFKPNNKEVYDVKKVSFDEFLSDVKKNHKSYAPWTRLAAQELEGYSPNLLKVELDKFLTHYDIYAKKYFEAKIRSTKKYSPIVSDFYKKLQDFSGRGKKMRAFLVWLGYQIGGGKDLNKILPISLAFELTQSFFLIHDDIIDRATLRRGKPTVHKIFGKKFGPTSPQFRTSFDRQTGLQGVNEHYGESMAIIAGDIAAIELFDLVSNSDFTSDLKILCQKELAKVILETAYGQILDVEYGYVDASLSDVTKVADLKAARYSFVGPLTLGAILSGAAEKQLKAIEAFGLTAGLAFQMQDDILGVFGDEAVLGKSTMSDLWEGKNTILIHKTKELAKGRDRDDLDKIWGNEAAKNKDLERVGAIITKSGALDWCKRENRRLISLAKKEIGKITNDQAKRALFGQIADFVINRTK
ncbi:MAG: polyprenyl synthetase family protein [Candidatus Curtissbacteria bacterium]|nr:polyprenyl synthetase family protein [Candidatus Curtissbacteria bacterium]